MTRKKSLALFQLTFLGEFVEMVTTVNSGEKDGMPLVVSGFLLDFDDNYFYVGLDHDEITQAVRRENVAYIGIVRESDELEEVLNSVPTPRNKDEGN